MKDMRKVRLAVLLVASCVLAVLLLGCSGGGCAACSDSDLWQTLTGCVDCSSCSSCSACASDSDVSGSDVSDSDVSGSDVSASDSSENDAEGKQNAIAEPVLEEPAITMPQANAVTSGSDTAAIDVSGSDTAAEVSDSDASATTATTATSVTTTAVATTTAATATATTAQSHDAVSVPTNPDGSIIIPNTAAALPMLSLLSGETLGVSDGNVLAVGDRSTREDTIIAICNPDGTTVVLLCHAGTTPCAIEDVAAKYPGRRVAVYRTDRECFVWLREQSSYVVHNGSAAVRLDPALEKPEWVTGTTTALTSGEINDIAFKLARARMYKSTRNGFVIVANNIDILRYAWGEKSTSYEYVAPQGAAFETAVPEPVTDSAANESATAPVASDTDALPMLTLIAGKSADMPDGNVLAIGARETREDAIIAIANPLGSIVLLMCDVDTTKAELDAAAALYPDRRAAVYRTDRECFVWLRGDSSYIVHNSDDAVSVDPALTVPSWVYGKRSTISAAQVKTVVEKLEGARQYQSTRSGFVVIANDIDIHRYFWGQKSPSYHYIEPEHFEPLVSVIVKPTAPTATAPAGTAPASDDDAATTANTGNDVVEASATTRDDGTVVIPNTGMDMPLVSLLAASTVGVEDGLVLAFGAQATREDAIIAITNPAGKCVVFICTPYTDDATIKATAKLYSGRRVELYRTEREGFVWLRGGSSFTVHGASGSVAVDPALTAPEWVTESVAMTDSAVTDALGKYEDATCYTGPRKGFVVVATENDIMRYIWGKRDYTKK